MESWLESITSPAALHRMFPDEYPEALCSVCKEGPANRWHVMWDCATEPDSASFKVYPVKLRGAIESASKSDQEWAIQKILTALERHGVQKGASAQ